MGGPLKPVFGLSGAVHLSPLAHWSPLLPEQKLHWGEKLTLAVPQPDRVSLPRFRAVQPRLDLHISLAAGCVVAKTAPFPVLAA